MTPDTSSRPATATSAILTLAAAAALLYAFRNVLWPFALAFALAVLIGSLARRVVSILPGAPRWLVFIVTALVVGAVTAGAMLIIVEGASRLFAQLPQVFQRLKQLLDSIVLPGEPALTLSDALARLDVAPAVASLAASLQEAASGAALTLLYLVFLLASGGMIQQRIQLIIASRASSKLLTVLERSVAGVEAYVYIQTLTGLMIALASTAAMFLVGLDNTLFWAVVIFMFAYLPIVGVLLGSIGPTLFALLQFPSLAPAVIIFVAIQAAGFIVGNLILPKMQADSQNIDPSASVLAIGVWTVLWGAPGAFLAIPLTLALMYALAQYDRLRWIAILMSNDGSPIPLDMQKQPVAEQA
jgi:AI-2 transport protein TqsA